MVIEGERVDGSRPQERATQRHTDGMCTKRSKRRWERPQHGNGSLAGGNQGGDAPNRRVGWGTSESAAREVDGRRGQAGSGSFARAVSSAERSTDQPARVDQSQAKDSEQYETVPPGAGSGCSGSSLFCAGLMATARQQY